MCVCVCVEGRGGEKGGGGEGEGREGKEEEGCFHGTYMYFSMNSSLCLCLCRFASQVDLSWTLSHQPSGMMAAIEEHIKALTEELASAKVICQLSCPEGCTALKNTVVLAKVVSRLAG